MVVITILYGLGLLFLLILFSIYFYDRFIQKDNLVKANFPIVGRFRYVFHDLRPFFRQYFGDDNAFVPRIIIDWIINVSNGKKGYFSFDKFDSSLDPHEESNQMIHSANPLNNDEMKPIYPTVGEKRKYPFTFSTYFYKTAMSLGSIGFEATYAMASAFAKNKTPFNTGEGGLSIQHIPNVKFNFQKFFKYNRVSKFYKIIFKTIPTRRLKNDYIDFLGRFYCEKNKRDLYLFDEKEFLFFKIDWEAPLEFFPTVEDLDDSFGKIILQIGSGLYGLRKKTKDGSFDFDFDRFKKITSFCRGIEIKLAQGAKQSGGILKAVKNTPTIAEIRGVHEGIDLISPNRFRFYEKGKEKEFFEFLNKLSNEASGKPIGIKIVISDEKNIIPIAKAMKENPAISPDWITIDGGDGGSGTAPISMGILFGKAIFPALDIVNKVLNEYDVRDTVKIFASSKLYSPHTSARALAHGADAIGVGRSVMISGGCIRAGLCSGEFGDCPVGLATLNKKKRKGYAQTLNKKIDQIDNYVKAHNQGLIDVAAIMGVDSPSKLDKSFIAKLSTKL